MDGSVPSRLYLVTLVNGKDSANHRLTRDTPLKLPGHWARGQPYHPEYGEENARLL